MRWSDKERHHISWKPMIYYYEHESYPSSYFWGGRFRSKTSWFIFYNTIFVLYSHITPGYLTKNIYLSSVHACCIPQPSHLSFDHPRKPEEQRSKGLWDAVMNLAADNTLWLRKDTSDNSYMWLTLKVIQYVLCVPWIQHVVPFVDFSQLHSIKSPIVQARVTANVTPAAVIAFTKPVSRVSVTNNQTSISLKQVKAVRYLKYMFAAKSLCVTSDNIYNYFSGFNSR